MDELEGWVVLGKYGIVLITAAGICYTVYKIALLFA